MSRLPNTELRTREYLTEEEITRLMEAARKHSRYPDRDATMILTAYRHGLRGAEVCDLRWDQIDFNGSTMYVRRVKRGSPSVHPILGDELRALRKLHRKIGAACQHVFMSERGAPLARIGFARIVERASERAGLEIKGHAHMLRHACGFTLANKGVDTRALQGYMGHKNINHTVRYTELRSDRFKDFWK